MYQPSVGVRAPTKYYVGTVCCLLRGISHLKMIGPCGPEYIPYYSTSTDDTYDLKRNDGA